MPDPVAPRFVDRPEDLPSSDEFAALSGLEIMQGILTGCFPAPPICRTVGFRLAEIGEGRAVFEGAPAFRHFNVLGGAHGGWFGIMLDSCMGCAVHTRLPPGKGYATLEYKVNIIRPAGPGTGVLRAVGAATHVGRRTGVAEGRLVDAVGRLYAQGSTTCLIFDF
jgi:uncharacterized protein (TIGR00369 family)